MAKEKALSTEDRILWGKVARTLRPLPGRMEDLLSYPAEPQEAPAAQPAATPKIVPGEAASAKPKPVSVKLHHPLEKPVKRKLSKGRLPIDARIDLHGLIQSEAHGLLLHFLLQAHQRGLRHVLVITGKGTSLGSDGALKRAVPLWFSLPEFRSLISSYESAARNHGGDGALYVRMARGSDHDPVR